MPYNEVNETRAAHLQQYATVDAKVTYLHPLGKVEGTIVRKTAKSVWVELQLPTGNAVTFRFSQRQNGEFKMHGKGEYSPALFFPQALADRTAAILAQSK